MRWCPDEDVSRLVGERDDDETECNTGRGELITALEESGALTSTRRLAALFLPLLEDEVLLRGEVAEEGGD